jgi:hypothetical protein
VPPPRLVVDGWVPERWVGDLLELALVQDSMQSRQEAQHSTRN